MRRLPILILLALAGCGADNVSAPKMSYSVSGDQATAHASSEAEAERACDAATRGDYPELRGVVQVQYRLPHSGGRDFTCMLP